MELVVVAAAAVELAEWVLELVVLGDDRTQAEEAEEQDEDGDDDDEEEEEYDQRMPLGSVQAFHATDSMHLFTM
jgi:hypothetical protein